MLGPGSCQEFLSNLGSDIAIYTGHSPTSARPSALDLTVTWDRKNAAAMSSAPDKLMPALNAHFAERVQAQKPPAPAVAELPTQQPSGPAVARCEPSSRPLSPSRPVASPAVAAGRRSVHEGRRNEEAL